MLALTQKLSLSPSPSSRPDRETQDGLARAALFRLLALGFAYPAPGHIEEMRRAFQKLGPAIRQNAFPPLVASRLKDAQRRWLTANGPALASEYLRLFHGNGAVSLHETAYGDGRRIGGRPVEMADINGFYLAFGPGIQEADPDLPDHLSVELEFMSLLLVKEGYALNRSWLPKARITRDAVKHFLGRHLGRWVRAFRESLRLAGAATLYKTLADLLDAVVADECRRHRVRPVLAEGRLSHDVMQDETYSCPHEGLGPASRFGMSMTH